MSETIDLIGRSPDELKKLLEDAGVPKKQTGMRVRQLWNWIYVHGARDFSSMTNLAKDFRAAVAQGFAVGRLETAGAVAHGA